jgi:hypothetical protein
VGPCTVKEANTLPPEIEQAEAGVVAMKPAEAVIAHVVSLVSNPQPMTPTGVPGGPDHWDSSMSGVSAGGRNVVPTVVIAGHEDATKGLKAPIGMSE